MKSIVNQLGGPRVLRKEYGHRKITSLLVTIGYHAYLGQTGAVLNTFVNHWGNQGVQ